MELKLSELIETLTELQKVAGDAPTNVSAVRLKADVYLNYGDSDPYGYGRRTGTRTRTWSIWCDSFTDGPQPPMAPVESGSNGTG